MLFNEPKLLKFSVPERADEDGVRFSALQRAEIAEIFGGLRCARSGGVEVSVLFNEPKLLK